MKHTYSIMTDSKDGEILKLVDENGNVVQRNIDGREYPNDTTSHFKAWKQARKIRDVLEGK